MNFVEILSLLQVAFAIGTLLLVVSIVWLATKYLNKKEQ